LNRLRQIARKRTRTALGLMSGTSGDGVDVVLAEISGKGWQTRGKILAFETYPYASKMRRRILGLVSARAEEICEMNFALGQFLGDCSLRLLGRAVRNPEQVDFIGSHGHTVYHLSGDPRRKNATLQIGEGAVIAARTGVITICDFRPGDIAAGGTGAPLVPYADYLLFRKRGKVRVLLNLGGIANITLVPEKLEDVIAFDTGPGNMVMDALVRTKSRGKIGWDPEGRIAARGKVRPALLGILLRHPFFREDPPKSTGREVFGAEFVDRLWSHGRGMPFEDLMATATYLTAASIHQGYRRFILPRYPADEVFVSGGGVHNRTLLGLLQKFFHPVPVGSLNGLGVDGDAKEALAFALLADATIQGLPSNVPAATGAERPAILGKIVL
jgi:anhydro-N-acetylmuramic acid kinase